MNTNSSDTIERLEKFIPSIAGISESNRKGLLHIVSLLKQERIEMAALIADAVETPDQFETEWNGKARAALAKAGL